MPTSAGRLTHLFLVRIWFEPGLAAEGQWRGMVEHGHGGERMYFASFKDLDDFIAFHIEGRPGGQEAAEEG